MSTQLLSQLYYDPFAGFQSAVNLRKSYNKQKPSGGKDITLKSVKEWLSKQEVNQRSKKIDRSKLQSYIPPEPLFQFQVDLIVLIKNNKIYHYALTCIDVFTKRAEVEYIGSKKTGVVVAKAMRSIFKRIGTPKTVFSDDGSEFIDSNFQN